MGTYNRYSLINSITANGYSHTLAIANGRTVYTYMDAYGNVYQTTDPYRPAYRLGNSNTPPNSNAGTDDPDCARDG